ncbi:MAG TPA: PfkB family carbohydrate kinase [Acidimicrobiales bacterium]|nr:PfkB family carbohydrate kinase [Acidimicrobiales bacterium]
MAGADAADAEGPSGGRPGRRSGRLVVVGALCLEHRVEVEAVPRAGETATGRNYGSAAGGRGLVQAVAAARQGADVALVGAVGDDAAGGLLTGLLVGEGVAVGGVRRRLGPSGAVLVTADGEGRPRMIVAPGANAALEAADVPVELVASAGVVLCHLDVPRPAVVAALRAAQQACVMSVLDVLGSGAARDVPDEILRLVDVVVLPASGAGPKAVVPTVVRVRTDHSATVVAGDDRTEVASFSLPAVDRSGEGDAYVGALAAALAAGEPVPVAARRAAAAAALAATRRGAVPSLPDRRAVDRLTAGPSLAAAGPSDRRGAPVTASESRPRSPSAGAPPGGPRRPPPRGARGEGRSGPPRRGGSRS